MDHTLAPPTPSREITPARAPEPTVRLPKVSVKPFSGDITQWNTLWDSFMSAIHDNHALSDVDKFNYLRSCWSALPENRLLNLHRQYPTTRKRVNTREALR